MPKWFWFLFTSFVLTLLVMLPILPAIQHTPEKNSGMFLYTSQQMLEGKLLYKEVWDHKPPLVFSLDALALFLGGGGLWGIWGMQFLFCFFTAFLILLILNRFFSAFSAMVGGICAMAALMAVNHGGNYSENYVLLLQVAAFWLALRAEKTSKGTWLLFGSGVLAGLAFMLKQNLISFWLALGLYLIVQGIFSKENGRWRGLFGLAAGFGLTISIFFGYFYLRGSFADFWDAAFRYNLAYSRLGLLERIKASLDVIEILSTIPSFVLGLAAWLFVLLLTGWQFAGRVANWLRWKYLRAVLVSVGGASIAAALLVDQLSGGAGGFGILQWFTMIVGVLALIAGIADGLLGWTIRLSHRLVRLTPPFRPEVVRLLSVAVLWFPFEMIMAGLSGRTYLYYLIPLAPVTGVLVGVLMHLMVDQAGRRVYLMRLAASSILVVVLAAPLISFPNSLQPGADPQIEASVKAVLKYSDPGDTVLTWGSEPLINFLAVRAQPSRYIHSWFFYTEHYALIERQTELLERLTKQKPALILDTQDPDAPFVENLQDCVYPLGTPPGILNQVFAFICKNYAFVEWVGPEKWPLYRYEG
ncbi:MAG: glycosyltransferase family 39 protein [Anaerolineaceae bacterium]|nr:glycosyltransferase family 39 protein [Anaerolineaceae bacterium]